MRAKVYASPSFSFLGFTHRCGINSKRLFTIRRQTLRARMHEPVAKVGEWLGRVLIGYNLYHAVPGNHKTLLRFRERIGWNWGHVLKRRSQRGRLTMARLARLTNRWLPRPSWFHSYPSVRFDARH